jgi:chemotaxis protein CheX
MTTTDSLCDTHPEAVCVREATQATFAMFTGGDPRYDGLSTEKEAGHHIIGIISLFGNRSRSLMLCLPEDTAAGIARKFCGFEIPFDSADMADVVGELVNILAGSVIGKLDSIGVSAEMSLPTVVRGTDVDLPVPDGLQVLRMGFSSGEGHFLLNLVAGDPHAAISR